MGCGVWCVVVMMRLPPGVPSNASWRSFSSMVGVMLDSGRLPDVDALRDEFLPTARSQRDVAIPPPDLHSYNSLIASGEVH